MDEPLRVLVVDDEAPARSRLKSLLEDGWAQINVVLVGEASSGAACLDWLASHSADVVLLDIRMPGMDGLAVAERIARLSSPPNVIFVTAYDAHAVAAFEVGARDYLLKPVRLERLVEALKRVQASVRTRRAAIERHFVVSDRGRVFQVPVNEVLYLRAELKYVTVRTREREYVLDVPLTKLEEDYPADFVRIHRNCLVNRAHLAGFQLRRQGDDTHWEAVLREWPEALPVSRRQVRVVKDFRHPVNED